MSVKQNYSGIFVEDQQERRAYVSKEDAVAIAEHFNLELKYKKSAAIVIVIGWILGVLTQVVVTVTF